MQYQPAKFPTTTEHEIRFLKKLCFTLYLLLILCNMHRLTLYCCVRGREGGRERERAEQATRAQLVRAMGEGEATFVSPRTFITCGALCLSHQGKDHNCPLPLIKTLVTPLSGDAS